MPNQNKNGWQAAQFSRYGVVAGILIALGVIFYVFGFKLNLTIIIPVFLAVAVVGYVIFSRSRRMEKKMEKSSKEPGYSENVGYIAYMEGIRVRMSSVAGFIFGLVCVGLGTFMLVREGMSSVSLGLLAVGGGFLVFAALLWWLAGVMEQAAQRSIFGDKKEGFRFLGSAVAVLAGLGFVAVGLFHMNFIRIVVGGVLLVFGGYDALKFVKTKKN